MTTLDAVTKKTESEPTREAVTARTIAAVAGVFVYI